MLKLIDKLKEKTKYIEWYNNQRKEYYNLIAKKIENKRVTKKQDFVVYELDDRN